MAAFTWGDAGAQMTPERIAAERKVAQALMAQGMDSSPVKHWTQGTARVMQGMMGGYDARRADEAEKANMSADKELIASLIAGSGTASPAVSVTAPSPTPSPLPAPSGAPVSSAPGKIYANDEPSPLDPPSGKDRDLAIRTVYGEAANEPSVGQQAVANVIRNRAVNGGYGGDTPAGVVLAKNQFEPWNTTGGRTRMASLDPNSPQYQKIGAAVDQAYTGDDPTNGATNFFAPKAQAALGRPVPEWGREGGQDIGGHRFIGGKPQPEPAPTALAFNGQPNTATDAPMPGSAPIDTLRPIINNSDGSFSTERTITVGVDGKFVNIPTIVNGRQVSPDEAIQLFKSGQNKAVGEYASQQEAEAGAQARSAQIGQVRGAEAGHPASPAVASVAAAVPQGGGPLAGVNPKALSVLSSPYASEGAKKIAGMIVAQQMKETGATDEIKEYNLYQRQGGKDNFFDYKSGLKKAGAQNITLDQRGESSFDTTAGSVQAKRFDELAGEAPKAKQMLSDVQILTDLGKNIGTGKMAEVKAVVGPYADALGIKVDGLSEIQAYEAVVNRVAPNLRVPGSGAQSDYELRNFLKALPNLGNTPEGNEIASSVMQGLYQNKINAAEIGAKALSKEITRPQAEKALRDLPDPMGPYREYMKKNRGAPTASGASPAVDRSAIEAEMKRRGLLK